MVCLSHSHGRLIRVRSHRDSSGHVTHAVFNGVTCIFPCLHKIISEGETHWNSGAASPFLSTLFFTCLLQPNSARLQESAVFLQATMESIGWRQRAEHSLGMASPWLRPPEDILQAYLCYIWVAFAKNSPEQRCWTSVCWFRTKM